jgi:solute carrier family 25 carnitine/acylcarnitine transporter 20/29
MADTSLLKTFLSGGAGGLCLVLVGHPFDLIKTRVQLGSTTAAAICCSGSGHAATMPILAD